MRLDRPAPYRVAANKRQARRSPGALKALEHRQRERDELRAIRADPSFGDRDPDRSRAFPCRGYRSEGHQARAGHRPAAVGARWRAQSHRRVSYPWHSRPAAGTTSTTQALATSGQAAAHRISSVRHVSREEGRSPRPPWRTTSRHIMAIISCSIGASCSRCANTVTAPARNSRKHTVTNATSGLTAGLSIRTIRPTSHGLDLGAGRARGRCHLHHRPLFSFRRAGGAFQKIRSPRAVDRPPRSKMLNCTIYD